VLTHFQYLMVSVESLFGNGDGHFEPWHQFHKCECKEVSQATLDFLHDTVGLQGEFHDGHGTYIIDMNLWRALLQYVCWCNDEQLDFYFHAWKVQDGDEFYIRMVAEKLRLFMA
jgi:hypothetical protein